MKITIYYTLIILLLLISCSSGRITDLEIEENEAIVIGKVIIYFDGEDITSKAKINFHGNIWGNHSYKPDHDKLLLIKLNNGKNYISSIHYKNNILLINEDISKFIIWDNKFIYDLGLIEIVWNGSGDNSFDGGLLSTPETVNFQGVEFRIRQSENVVCSLYVKNAFDPVMQIKSIKMNIPDIALIDKNLNLDSLMKEHNRILKESLKKYNPRRPRRIGRNRK